MEHLENFAKQVKSYRLYNKLTQTELGQAIGVSKQSIINYEKGTSFPSGERLSKLSKLIGMEPTELLQHDNFKSSEELEWKFWINEHGKFELNLIQSDYSNLNESERKKILLNYMKDNMESVQIKQAITQFFKLQKETVSEQYTNELIQNTLNPELLFDGDITVTNTKD